MANYDMASYSLRFTTDFKEIEVVSGNSVVTSYNLQASNQSVSVMVDDDDYVVAYASNFTTATNTIDVGAGATIEFDNTRMGGIGILDLRNMKEEAPEPGTFEFQYDLECTTFFLKYVSGPFALRIYFTNVDCVSYVEAG